MGALVLIGLIIGGVVYWNHRLDEYRGKKMREEGANFSNVGQPPITPTLPEDFRKENERRAEEWKRFEEAARHYQNRP
jgi:hypothetical protein